VLQVVFSRGGKKENETKKKLLHSGPKFLPKFASFYCLNFIQISQNNYNLTYAILAMINGVKLPNLDRHTSVYFFFSFIHFLTNWV